MSNCFLPFIKTINFPKNFFSRENICFFGKNRWLKLINNFIKMKKKSVGRKKKFKQKKDCHQVFWHLLRRIFISFIIYGFRNKNILHNTFFVNMKYTVPTHKTALECLFSSLVIIRTEILLFFRRCFSFFFFFISPRHEEI